MAENSRHENHPAAENYRRDFAEFRTSVAANQSGNSFGSGSGNGNQVNDIANFINIGRQLGTVQTKAL